MQWWITYDCEAQIMVANIGGQGKTSNFRRQIILYPSDIKTSVAFSPIFGLLYEFVLSPQSFAPIATDWKFVHPSEEFPKIVGHPVDDSDVVEWAVESETKEIVLGKIEII